MRQYIRRIICGIHPGPPFTTIEIQTRIMKLLGCHLRITSQMNDQLCCLLARMRLTVNLDTI